QPGHPVRPGGRGRPRERRTHGVSDDPDLLVGPGPVDRGDDRVDHVLGRDAGAVGVAGLHAGQGHRLGAVSARLQRWGHLRPGRAVEPEPGNEDEVHEKPPVLVDSNDPLPWIIRTYSYDAAMSSAPDPAAGPATSGPPASPDYAL